VSEIESNLDKAASAYWRSVVAKAGPDHAAALINASNLERDSRAEARISDSGGQPTLNTLEGPPLDVLNSKPLTL
jgi:hypothetical protein